MSGIWIKVWTDLWSNKIRTSLAVLSIAAGVFGVGAMFGMADLLQEGMNSSHRASLPPHFQFELSGTIEQDTIFSLQKIPGVMDVEGVNTQPVRFKLNPGDEWERALVVMRDDYEQQPFDLYTLRAGQWPRKRELGVERMTSDFHGVELGNTVIFEINGREKEFSINGLVRHPFVPPPAFGGEAYFFTDAQGMEFFGSPPGKFDQLRARVIPYSLELSKQVAAEMKSRLSKEGIGVASTFYQNPNKHWGGDVMDTMLMTLQLLSVVSLGASVVLVLNTINAIIAQQTHQIGIMKAIGATTGNMFKIYLAVVLVYGVLALLIALPLSALMAFIMTKSFLYLFNIDYNEFQVSTRAIVYQTIAALMVPVVVVLWPVLRGTGITVRQAIANYGLGGDFGESRLDRVVERAAQTLFSAPYVIAICNTFRRKGRLILTQVVLVTAGTMAVIVMSMSTSISLTLDNVLSRNKYNTILTFDNEERIDRVIALAEAMDEVTQAEVRFGHPVSIFKQGQLTKEAGLGTELVGIPANSTMFRPLLVAGRWLQPNDNRTVVMSEETAADNHINLGDTITLDLNELGRADWQVVGFYHDIFAGTIDNINALYATQEAVSRATKTYNRGRNLFVRTQHDHPDYVDKITAQLKNLYDAKNIKVEDAHTFNEDREMIEGQFGVTSSLLMAVAIIVAVVGGIGLMGALSISVVERTREIGVMRAIGARTYTVMGLFLTEGLLQGLLSWLLVIPASFILGKPLSSAFGQIMFGIDMDYQYNLNAAFTWLVVVLIIAALASIIPARNATRISVRQSLAYQ